MPHYITFQRTYGHCYISFISGETFREALCHFVAQELGAEVLDDRTLELCLWPGEQRQIYQHPLETIEKLIKATPDADELEINSDGTLRNHRSWEVRELLSGALFQGYSDIMTTSEPQSLSGYIASARKRLLIDHPESNARAFVWYLNQGPLVSFLESSVGANQAVNIVARYLILWDTKRSCEDIIPWLGDYDALEAAMRLRF